MKIRMIADWSESKNYPKKDTELVVKNIIQDEKGYLEYYICNWKEDEIDVYPYECQIL